MKFSNFDEIGNYVYSLSDPETNEIFYIGRGVGNRVFQHAKNANDLNVVPTDKIEKIREIHSKNKQVVTHIIRHQLSEDEAKKVECALLDLMKLLGNDLTNIQGGYNSEEYGLMTTDEIERKYCLEKIDSLPIGFIAININKSYKLGHGKDGIYQATKEAWVINKSKLPKITHVLSEFKGRVVGVFKVNDWYPITTNTGKVRYGFNGTSLNDSEAEIYLNKKVPLRKKGAIAPVRYNFDWDS